MILKKKTKQSSEHDEDHVVYQFNCPNDGCKAIDTSYIGFTTNTLKMRSEHHHNNGAIRNHFETKHKLRPTTETILTNTKILKHIQRKDELMLYEAILIKKLKPLINLQTSSFTKTLKIF